MRKTISACCRQALTGAAFWTAALGTAAVFAAAAFQRIYTAVGEYRSGLLEYGFHRNLLEEAFVSDTFVFALPVLAAIPFTASYVDDIRSGFVKEYLPRTRVRDYIAGKLAGCMVSGGLCLVLGIVIFYALTALVFLPMEAAAPGQVPAEVWLAPLITRCILAFAQGTLWSLAGMTMAALTGSRYMAYAAPFILYYVLIILCERYFKGLYVFYPKEWLSPEGWPGGVWGVTALLAVLAAVWGSIFSLTAGRRLERI